jgi:hypothetical protein
MSLDLASPSELAAAVRQRLEKTQHYVSHIPEWRRRVWAEKWGGRCLYCGVPFIGMQPAIDGREPVPVTSDHLFPLSQGGLCLTNNMVTCCLACNASKHNQDWISWGKAVDKKDLMKRREAALMRGVFNHLTRDPSLRKNKKKLLAHMRERWSHPRFTAFVWCGPHFATFGFKRWQNTLTPEALAILKWQGGAELFYWEETYRQVAVVPRERFIDTAWALIEAHGYLKRVGPRGYDDCTPQDDPDAARWGEVFADFRTLTHGRFLYRNKKRGLTERQRFARAEKWKEAYRGNSLALAVARDRQDWLAHLASQGKSS